MQMQVMFWREQQRPNKLDKRLKSREKKIEHTTTVNEHE